MIVASPASPGSTGCAPTAPLAYRFDAMATTFELALPADFSSDGPLCAEAVQNEIARIESLLSRHLPHSDIAAINRSPVGQRTLVSAETAACIQQAHTVWLVTEGAFDPTIGAILSGRSRWQDGRPSPAANDWGFQHLAFYPATRQIERRHPDVQLDLGAIGKGYAVDAAARVLADWAPDWAFLSAGKSSLRIFGTPPSSDGWCLRLYDPRDEKTVLHELWLTDRALGTSSRRGDHILDPQNGAPVSRFEGGWAVAASAAAADALATAALLLPDDLFFSGAWGEPGDELWRFSADRGLEHARSST